MKKEFKAPVIEAKNLSVMNSVMADLDILTKSGNANADSYQQIEDTVAEGFKIWKGISQ